MAKLTKKQKAMAGKVDPNNQYAVAEAIGLVKSLATSKFDETVGAEDLMEAMQGGDTNYDRVIATPDRMGIVGRLGKCWVPRA